MELRKIFWRKFVTGYFGAPLTSIVGKKIRWKSMVPQRTALFPTFFIISSFVFSRTNTFIQSWNYWVSKWWQNFHFWVNYPFKTQSLNKSPVCNVYCSSLSVCVFAVFWPCSVSESVQGVMICPLLAVSIRGPLEFSQNALCSDRASNVDWASALTWLMRNTCCQRASQPISWSSLLGFRPQRAWLW